MVFQPRFFVWLIWMLLHQSPFICTFTSIPNVIHHLHHAFKPGSNESPRTHAKNVFFSQSQNKLTQHKSKSLTNLNSVDLSTCLEWLALEKENNLPNFHIQWFDPSDASSFSNNDSFIMEQMKNSEEEELQRMPLYPLNACYIPSLSHQILNNIQPRNICMAQDLAKGMYHKKFCVTIYASDTGRVAQIGTIMKVIDIETHYEDPTNPEESNIRKIIVTCSPQQRVSIQNIENPSAWNSKQRLLKSKEYLMAHIKPLVDIVEESKDASNIRKEQEQIIQQIEQDYAMIRFTYKSQDPTSIGTLPPFSMKALQGIPPLDPNSLFSSSELQTNNNIDTKTDIPNNFWTSLEQWQNLCYTLREAKRLTVQSDIDEIMIQEAMKQPGPLNLPVHKEDLPISIQRDIESTEREAFQEFCNEGMDPCLNVQNILSCTNHTDRLKLFQKIIARERQRLEARKQVGPVSKFSWDELLDEPFQ